VAGLHKTRPGDLIRNFSMIGIDCRFRFMSAAAGSFIMIIMDSEWSQLRLKDRIASDLRVLFVGINPGVRSVQIGHHFAGYSNRFWKLLTDSGLTPEPVTWKDDDRLPSWRLGITNLIARPSPGIEDLRPSEYVEGWKVLHRKIHRLRPRIVALVGVTAYRAILPLLRDAPTATNRRGTVVGLHPIRIHGAQVFVLPNPSGRNANFTYPEMLKAFVALRRSVDEADA
jgi:double-stranded uracil-DNA glycosylase